MVNVPRDSTDSLPAYTVGGPYFPRIRRQDESNGVSDERSESDGLLERALTAKR
jgi:hypothetical protein